ncbi:MAG: hypothetical protein SWK76_12520 [Actinomycetota bacterium]|nr:hypothetical protein [Actinomycetota bacterium]
MEKEAAREEHLMALLPDITGVHMQPAMTPAAGTEISPSGHPAPTYRAADSEIETEKVTVILVAVALASIPEHLTLSFHRPLYY